MNFQAFTSEKTGFFSDPEDFRAFLRNLLASTVIPSSVYRLQFNKDFTFKHAEAVLPYLKQLGVDAVYASPYFRALSGSMHGYNVTDPNQINPEIGTERDFQDYCAALEREGLKQILDVVPNHMGIQGSQNPWWADVLENGPASIFSSFFDINWEPVKKELKGKILLPVLGDSYGAVLEKQEIQLREEQGRFFFQYYDQTWPLAPETFPLILLYQVSALEEKLGTEDADFHEYLSIATAFASLPSRYEKMPEKIQLRYREKEVARKRLAALMEKSGWVREFIAQNIKLWNGSLEDPHSFDLLDQLLNEQVYRLAFWRVASEEINYRRFFNINELVAIRTEDRNVFEQYHQFIFKLIRENKIHGLRIDHPDGLYDPPEYFERLQEYALFYKLIEKVRAERDIAVDPGSEQGKALFESLCECLGEEEFLNAKFFYVVVEKILETKENLPQNWNVHGTVGYEFLNTLSELFVQQENADALSEVYEKFIGFQVDFHQVLYDKKKIFTLVQMASEVNELGHRLDQISEGNRIWRDFTRNNLTLAIREVIAAFPVYRTYIPPQGPVSERDGRYIHIAIEKAKSKAPALTPAVFDFLKRVLLLDFDEMLDPESEKQYRDFVLRFQQLTGPVMAKGLEDTSFYIYNRLTSLNEVGGDPTVFGFSPEEFHRRNLERSQRWPYSFVSTSTHDTKRSEDIRMRIHVLSEMPLVWKSQIERWAVLNQEHKTLLQDTLVPRRNLEYFIYQTLLGVWPDIFPQGEELKGFQDRLWEYFQKASREAMLYTSWANPNLEYEAAVKKFIFGILSTEKENLFLESFAVFQNKIASFGLWNALSALVLKMGAPGVADIYQGTEFWNYALVDPDNRRPVNFEQRAASLNALSRNPLSELIGSRWDGRLKLFVMAKALQFRKQNPQIFLQGAYVPLKLEGEKKSMAAAFMRKTESQSVIIAAGRFFSQALSDPAQIPAGEVWSGTFLMLPDSVEEGALFQDCFTGKEIQVQSEKGHKVLPVPRIFSHLSAAILIQV